MEWTRLELSKASVLRKEVDVALRMLARAAETSGPNSEGGADSQSQGQAAVSLGALAESIQARAREIEAFYHQNDHDERSILFEKQRLRLRRALQSLNNGQPSASAAAAGAAAPASPRGQSRSPPPALASPVPHQSGRSIAGKSPAGNSQTVRTTPKAPGGSDNIFSARRTPLNESSAWPSDSQSLRGGGGPPIRTRITTDMGSFIPSNLPGIYVSDVSTDASGAPASTTDGLIDTQIILTPEEFRAYVSRRKNVVAANEKKRLVDKLCPKSTTMMSPLSVAASGPYVDPKRIQKELFRPEQPHKWVGGPGGFKPSH